MILPYCGALVFTVFLEGCPRCSIFKGKNLSMEIDWLKIENKKENFVF